MIIKMFKQYLFSFIYFFFAFSATYYLGAAKINISPELKSKSLFQDYLTFTVRFVRYGTGLYQASSILLVLSVQHVLGCDCNLRAMFSDTIFVILKITAHLVASTSSFWR